MVRHKRRQAGFGATAILVFVLVIGAMAAVGWLVYQRYAAANRPAGAANTPQSTNQQKDSTSTQTQHDPYEGWKTFTDNASAGTSGISVKYPPDGQVRVGNSKVYAWTIASTQGGALVRYVFLTNSETAHQEWDTCAATISGDACGAAPGDKTLTGSESTINGLDAYSATMQGSNGGTYHVTVIRGDKSTPPAGTPYVEFITDSTDQTGLNIFDKIVASATFPD